MSWYIYIAYAAITAVISYYTWRRGWIDGYVEASLTITPTAEWYDDEDVIIEDALAMAAEVKPEWLYEEDGQLVNGGYHTRRP